MNERGVICQVGTFLGVEHFCPTKASSNSELRQTVGETNSRGANALASNEQIYFR